jgi:hypothetical protein
MFIMLCINITVRLQESKFTSCNVAALFTVGCVGWWDICFSLNDQDDTY